MVRILLDIPAAPARDPATTWLVIAVAVLAIVVAVLSLLVAGLLRSHAAILRRLHELGAGVDDPVGTPPERPSRPADPGLPQPPAVAEGRPAADLVGVGPTGDALAVRVAGARHDTVLAFLSSGCTTCQAFWEQLGAAGLPTGTRLVIVTRGDDVESPVAVADVAPPDVAVVMSSAAWTDYEVPGSPYVVHVDGVSGRVRGEGTGPDWDQVKRMLLQGAGDLDARRAALVGAGGTGGTKAAADARREEEIDRMLLAAGIEPGDPSLYTRADGSVTERPA
jgi:hypothetical protein